MKQDARRGMYAAWLAALGINPGTVPIDAEFIIKRPDDAPPTLSVEIFRMRSDGRPVYGWQTVLLTIEPPSGHLPNEPGHADLLAALDRARKLADQWAMLRTHGGAAYELRAALDIPGDRP